MLEGSVEFPFGKTFWRRLHSRRMRSDWDLRARQNARYYIACGHSDSDAEFWRSGYEELEKHVLRDLRVDPAARALEIGCGIGRLLRPLSERVERAVGVDISQEMVSQGTKLLADRPNVILRQTDGDLSGTPTASLDFVYSFTVFQHIPTKEAVSRYLREAARVLKGKGLFRFQVDSRPREVPTEPDTWVGVSYQARELEAELIGLGFEVLDVFGEGTHYLWMTARRRREPTRPDTEKIQYRETDWDIEVLDCFLVRLDYDPDSERERVISGEVSLRRLADRFLAENETREPEDFVRRAYRVFLDREADDGGLRAYASEISSGIARSNVIDCLLVSAEFAERHRRPRGGLSSA